MSVPSGRLPRGRHGLSRQEVIDSQRNRIFTAMATVMAEKGFAGTSVADVLAEAGVSRETFYEQFTSKTDCFMSAMESAVVTIFSSAWDTDGAETQDGWRGFERALRAYLDALAANPTQARMFLIEVYAAGPEALARRAAIQELIAEVLNQMFGARSAADRFANEVLVAGISSLVTSRLAVGDLDGLRALDRPLTELARRLHPG